jgi:hypothetical protein
MRKHSQELLRKNILSRLRTCDQLIADCATLAIDLPEGKYNGFLAVDLAQLGSVIGRTREALLTYVQSLEQKQETDSTSS